MGGKHSVGVSGRMALSGLRVDLSLVSKICGSVRRMGDGHGLLRSETLGDPAVLSLHGA